MRSFFISLLVACLLGLAQALSSSGTRLLVVLDELSEQDKYSQFWKDLKSRGFELTFSTPKSEPAIFRHGERTCDHLLILPTKLKALGPQLTPNILLDFVKADGNILLALSSSRPTPSTLVSLLLEFGIQLPDDLASYVVDHFNYDKLSASDKHDVVLVPRPGQLRPDLKNYFGGEGILASPRTVGQVLSSSSPYINPILKASDTAYSYSPVDDENGAYNLFAPGRQVSLISSMQARNSARVTVLGSAELLEDTWFDAKIESSNKDIKDVSTENRKFAAKLSAWAFKELGVLKVTGVKHFVNEGNPANVTAAKKENKEDLPNPKMYRIKNDVTYSISLSEYSNDRWIPFRAPEADAVQLEFTMLSPYHRLSLTHRPKESTKESSAYATSFTLPDQHGIFSFRVNYKRPFLTTVEEKDHVTVRHFAHDEWPRSWVISGAWVWIAGIWGTVVGWLFFVAVWLYSAPTDPAKVAKKTN